MIPRFISALVGLWLMASPVVLGYFGPARINDRVCGPLIATFAIIALWEVTREVRWLNVLLAFWLMLAPLLLHYPTWTPVVNSLACAAVLVVAAVAPGSKTGRYAGGWKSLFAERDEK